MEVPVKATIASCLLTIAFSILYPIYLAVGNFWQFMIGTNLCIIIPLPLILFLTIKQKNDKKLNVQPPNKLQFHDENFVKGTDEVFLKPNENERSGPHKKL